MNISLWPLVGFLVLMAIVLVRSKFTFRTTLYVYLVIHTAALVFWPYESIGILGDMFKYQLRSSHAQSLAYLLLLPLIFDRCFPTRWLWRSISWVFIIDAVAILFGWRGITWGLSFDSAFIALLLPTFYRPTWYHRVLTALALVAIYKVGGATAYLVIGLMLVGAAITYKNWLWLTICCPLFAVGYWSLGYELYRSPGRLAMWVAWFKWWLHSANHYIGTGPGSFEWLANTIYSDTGGYTFAHNDYLQILFECGIVGIVLALGTIVEALWSLRRNHVIFTTAVGYLAFMCTYSPLHVFPGMLLAILIFVGARNARITSRLRG